MTRWNRTHEALSRAAMELFVGVGYEVTTTAQIAERAGVSEMTLFRHFASKETLLLADPFDPLMAEAVRARPTSEPSMRALAEGIRQALAHVDGDSVEALRARLRIVAEAPSLRGAVERNSEETITALAAALTERGVSPRQATAAATAMIAGLGAALLTWARSSDTGLVAELEKALDILGGQ